VNCIQLCCLLISKFIDTLKRCSSSHRLTPHEVGPSSRIVRLWIYTGPHRVGPNRSSSVKPARRWLSLLAPLRIVSTLETIDVYGTSHYRVVHSMVAALCLSLMLSNTHLRLRGSETFRMPLLFSGLGRFV